MWRMGWLLAAGLLAAPGGAGAVCLRMEVGDAPAATMPAAPGAEVRLSFRHSLYGSEVQEDFRLTRKGFQLVRLRYAERRLAEFYGHEAARLEGGWWVVENVGREVAMLTLRVTRDSRMQIGVGAHELRLWEVMEPGGLFRLAVTSCRGGEDGRQDNR